MFSNYVKTMKNSGLRATPALVAYRPALPKKQEVIGRFSVGRVGPVGRVGRYHARSICARPATHEQNVSGLRAAPALLCGVSARATS